MPKTPSSTRPVTARATAVVPSYRTKSGLAYASLRADILDGRLAPGTSLVIGELARTLQISTIPVREALHQLASEGLVTIRPHADLQVAAVDPAAAPELAVLMEALEIAAVRLACDRADAPALEHLAACCAQLDAARTANDRPAWAEANTAFHLAIIAAARMDLGAAMATRVLVGWERLRRWCFPDSGGVELDQADREHRALVAALKQRDVVTLETITAAHNRAAAQAMIGTKNRL